MNLRASSLGGGGGEKREQERESKNAGFGKSDYTALMKISENFTRCSKVMRFYHFYDVFKMTKEDPSLGFFPSKSEDLG